MTRFIELSTQTGKFSHSPPSEFMDTGLFLVNDPMSWSNFAQPWAQ